MEKHEMSVQEKRILMVVVGESPELPFATEQFDGADGMKYVKYIIPKDKRKEVFEALNPFAMDYCPEQDVTDLHTNKVFKMKDYDVIRYDGRNLIVSPYFAERGGMIVDFIPVQEDKDGKEA